MKNFSYYRYFETRRRFNAIALQICIRICHEEGSDKVGGLKIKWYTSAAGLCRWC